MAAKEAQSVIRGKESQTDKTFDLASSNRTNTLNRANTDERKEVAGVGRSR